MAKTKIDDLSVVISASTGHLPAELRNAARMFNDFKKSVDKANADTGTGKKLAREVDQHKKAAKEIEKGWRGVGLAKSAIMGGVAGLAAGAGFAAAKIGIGGLTDAFNQLKDSVDLAANLEMTTLAFEVMLKSGERAKEMIAEIRKFAAQTPFNATELTDSSRKLLAYGIAGDQVIPTLRMLGDVASATQTPIADLSYLYGTLAAQQRAYTRDIYQFANRGIPIYEELSKVLGKSVAETKDLIEEGRVGFPEVVRAFKAMTEGTGRYAGLTEKQGQTFAGAREQLFDAIQQAKIKLGMILIDELGLKQGAKDLQEFTKNIERHLDRIRPGVKLIGELARSVGQVAYEFGKAAIQAGDFVDVVSEATAPEIRAMLNDLKEFLLSGKEFKLDPVAVNESLFLMADVLAQLFIDALKGFRDIGETIRREILIPMGEGFQRMLHLWVEGKDLVGQADNSEKFRPPHALENDKRIVERFKALLKEIGKANEIINIVERPGNPQLAGLAEQYKKDGTYAQSVKNLAELMRLERAFLGEFHSDDAQFRAVRHLLAVEGKVPPMKARDNVLLGDNGWIQRAITGMEQRRNILHGLKADVRERLLAEQAQKAADAFGEVTAAAALAAGGLAKLIEPDRPDVPFAIGADVQDAAKRANDQFKFTPLEQFKREFNALGEAAFHGLIGDDVLVKAQADLVRRFRENMGAQYQLPNAAEKGSADAVRILNQSMTGRMRSEDFLKQLVEIEAQQLEASRELLRQNVLPIIIPVPK